MVNDVETNCKNNGCMPQEIEKPHFIKWDDKRQKIKMNAVYTSTGKFTSHNGKGEGKLIQKNK